MDRFLTVVGSFPTAIFSVLLVIAVLYWLISMTGMLGDLDADGLDAGDGSDADGSAVGGMLEALGIRGIPLSILLTLTFLFAWVFSYSISSLFGGWWSGVVAILVGVAIIPVALVIGLLITATLLRPFRAAFHTEPLLATELRVIGQVGVVISGEVNTQQGRAEVHLNGAHMIFNVRSETPLHRGDLVIFMDYRADQHLYRVIPETPALTTSAMDI